MWNADVKQHSYNIVEMSTICIADDLTVSTCIVPISRINSLFNDMVVSITFGWIIAVHFMSWTTTQKSLSCNLYLQLHYFKQWWHLKIYGLQSSGLFILFMEILSFHLKRAPNIFNSTTLSISVYFEDTSTKIFQSQNMTSSNLIIFA